jgi:hypothetical protein
MPHKRDTQRTPLLVEHNYMSAITIRRGLRRLEFTALEDTAPTEAKTHVLVEFAVEGRLPDNQIVSINLGIRSGIERTLQGVPQLVQQRNEKSDKSEKSKDAFLYRLEGNVR